MTELERAERELERARAAMDASTYHGRNRTDVALAEVKRLLASLSPDPAPGEDVFSSEPPAGWVGSPIEGIDPADMMAWKPPALSHSEGGDVEAVARAIAKRRMLTGDMGGIMAISPDRFEAAFETVWNGTTDLDERQRENYRGDARAAIAALRPSASKGAGERWQPIETAPKDGTDVLLFYPLEGLRHEWNPQVVIGHWRQFKTDADASWVFQSRAVRGYSPEYRPTHWQPLDEPPAIDQGQHMGGSDE